jgi:hypothetical protein
MISPKLFHIVLESTS